MALQIMRVPLGADTSAFLASRLRDAARGADLFSQAPCIHIASNERRARMVSRLAGELYPQGTADRVARELLRLFAPELEARGEVERDFDFFAALRETLNELGESRRPGRALVDQLIAAWKRLAQTVPPDQRDAEWLDALGSRGALFRGVVRRYQARLREVGAYDPEDALWLTAERLAGWKISPLLVVIDDVDRITPAREALIRALALKSQRTLAICAGIRGQGDEPAFTADSHDKLQALMHEQGGQVIEEATWPERPLAQTCSAWMKDERAFPGATQILKPPTRAAEVREAARAIKRAHRDRVPLSEICVAMPSLNRYRELIEETFHAAGIPYDAPFEVPLSQAAPVAPLLDLLRAARNGLSRNELLDALASPLLPLDSKDDTERMKFLSAFGLVTREAWVVGGKDARKDWIAKLDASSQNEWPPIKARVEKLLSLLTPFTRRGMKAARFIEGIEALLDAGGVERVVKADRMAGNEGAALRAGALHAFKALLRQMREEFERIGNPDLPTHELARALTEQAERRSVRQPEAAAERVRVLGLRELRGVSFQCVIVIGLTDQDLPLAEEQTMFFPPSREEALAEAIAGQSNIQNPTSRIAAELCSPIDVTAQADYLFAHTLLALGTEPREAEGPSPILLMFPAAEGDTPCVPATPLARLLRCLGIVELPAFAAGDLPTSSTELAAAAARALAIGERPSKAGPERAAFSLTERALERALPAGPVIALSDSLCTGLHGRAIELARTDPASPPGEFEGMVGDLPELAARFAPQGDERHTFSPSQLDNYAECPLRFWARYIVRAKAPDEPTLDTRPHAIGTLLHEVFERFVLLLRKHAGHPDTLADPASREAVKLSDHGGREVGLRLMAEAFEHAVSVAPGEGPFWDGVKKLVASGLPGHADEGLGSGLLARFIDAELERNAQGNGIRFVEFTFGMKADGPDSLPDVLELPIEGGSVRLMGSVDRVDEGPAGLEILDYKTGNTKTTAEVRDGKAFQLPAYLAAISQLAGSAPSGMGYLQVPPDGPIQHVDVTQYRGKPAYDVADLVSRQLPERLARMLDGLRHGTFLHLPWAPPGKPCRYCDYRTACAKRDDMIAQRQQMMPEVKSVYLPDE